MPVPSNILINLGNSVSGTIPDSVGVGTGLTHHMNTVAGEDTLNSRLTVNSTNGVLDVLPLTGAFGAGTLRNILGTRTDTRYSFQTYMKIPLDTLRVFPVTVANNNAGIGMIVGNDVNVYINMGLDITLVSGTTYRWGIGLSTKTAHNSISVVGSRVTVTSNVADTLNSFVEMWLKYNRITEEWTMIYKFSNEALVTVARPFTMTSAYKAAVINADIFTGMYWRRSSATGATTSKMETDIFKLDYLEAEIGGTAQANPATLLASGDIKRFLTVDGTVASQNSTMQASAISEVPVVFNIPSDNILELGTPYPGTLLDADGQGTGFTHVIPSTGHIAANLNTNGINGLSITPDPGLIGSSTLKNILALPINATYGFTIRTTINLADLRQYTPTLAANNTTVVGLAHTNAAFDYVIRSNFEIAQVGSVYKWILKVSGKTPSNGNLFTTVYEIGTLISDTTSQTVELTLTYNLNTNMYSTSYKADNKNRVVINNFRQLDSAQQTNLLGASNSYAGLITKKSATSGSQGFPVRYYKFSVGYNVIQFQSNLQSQSAKLLGILALNPLGLSGTITSNRATLVAALNKTFYNNLSGTATSQRSAIQTGSLKLGNSISGIITPQPVTLTAELRVSSTITLSGTVASRKSQLSNSSVSSGKTIEGILQSGNATVQISLTLLDTFKPLSGNIQAENSTVSGLIQVKSNIQISGQVFSERASVQNIDNAFLKEYNFFVKSFLYASVNALSGNATISKASEIAALKVKSFFTIGGTLQSRPPNLSVLLSVSPIFLDFTQEAAIIVYNQTENAILFYSEPQSGVQVTQSSGSVV